MPTISYFYGITIAMHWREGHHWTPHFHAYYAEYEASLDLSGNLIAGFLPKRALRLVQDWAELHAMELHSNWELAANQRPPMRIEPLR
jgi:Domain of unknown function (DUF4160)